MLLSLTPIPVHATSAEMKNGLFGQSGSMIHFARTVTLFISCWLLSVLIFSLQLGLMVNKYKSKNLHGKWSEASLAAAMAVVKKGEITIRKASSSYGIPFGTPHRHLKTGSSAATWSF